MPFPTRARLSCAAPLARLLAVLFAVGVFGVAGGRVAEAAPTPTSQPTKESGKKDALPPPVTFTPAPAATTTPAITATTPPAATPTAPAAVTPTVPPAVTSAALRVEGTRVAETPTPGATSDPLESDSSQASGLASLRAMEEAGSDQASGLSSLRATMTAVPRSDDELADVEPSRLEAIARGCDPHASSPDVPADLEPASGASSACDLAGIDPSHSDQVEQDDAAARRRRALELGAARVVPSVELNEYAHRLARLNAWLVSPFGEIPLTSRMIQFGYLGDYGEELAFEVRGEAGVAVFGTRHYGLDLQIPWLPDGGRGVPIVAPFDGRIIRTADPVGGPFGIWLESRELNLRARLMHMDGLVIGVESGAWVQAGQQLGILGAQGTEGFPHLHLSFERLSDGARMNPALFYRLQDWTDVATYSGEWLNDPAAAPVMAFRRPATAANIPDGDGRAIPRSIALAALPLDMPLPTRVLASLWGPIELPYP